MNDEIIRALEKEFPEPWDLAARINQLTLLMGALRKTRGYERAIDALSAEVLHTIEGVADGRVPDLDEASRKRIREHLEEWKLHRAEEEEDRAN